MKRMPDLPITYVAGLALGFGLSFGLCLLAIRREWRREGCLLRRLEYEDRYLRMAPEGGGRAERVKEMEEWWG